MSRGLRQKKLQLGEVPGWAPGGPGTGRGALALSRRRGLLLTWRVEGPNARWRGGS